MSNEVMSHALENYLQNDMLVILLVTSSPFVMVWAIYVFLKGGKQ